MRSKMVAAILFAGLMTILAPRAASATWSVSISYFQRNLSPYGTWVYTSAYGEIWHPTVVAATWAPYVYGEWVYTDCGWTWVSYDPFGQDPFHYGTWVWVDAYGWCWEPGYVWGPGWVTWAYTDTYIGWAPLPPTFVFATSGYVGSPVVVSQSRYVFVPVTSFVGTNVSTVRVAASQNPTILANAQRVTRFSVSGGLVRATDPPPSIIERATGRTLQRTSLSAHKLSPVPITAVRAASGRRLSITAPKQDRALAAKGARTSGPKIAQQKPMHQTKIAEQKPMHQRTQKVSAGKHAAPEVSRHAEASRGKPAGHAGPARTESVVKHASRQPAAARETSHAAREAKTSGHHGETRSASAATGHVSHREASASAAPAPRIAESRRASPPSPPREVRHEERPIAMNSAPRERPQRSQPASPPPQAGAHQPPPGPPPVAARPAERPPQAQAQKPKKERPD
jgi:hypothetical protein